MPARTPDRAHQSARASTLSLPPGAWVTVYDCLCAHFPAVSPARWLERFEHGRITDAGGRSLDVGHRYRLGMIVRYFREVPEEVRIPFEAAIVHVDEHLVIADKPHFLPVTPAGRFVEQTLLHRLGQALGNTELAPLHRIDRGTAGLVMFSAQPATRSLYQALFREQRIEKRYEALAPALPQLEFPLLRQTRLVPGEPFFRMRETEGPANSASRIDVLERDDGTWRYRLDPLSGRKHQLRVHMAALGAPILNDDFYPVLREHADDDFERPLKLLARSLDFIDPLTGARRHFESARTL